MFGEIATPLWYVTGFDPYERLGWDGVGETVGVGEISGEPVGIGVG
jgi:hypothetical protein